MLQACEQDLTGDDVVSKFSKSSLYLCESKVPVDDVSILARNGPIGTPKNGP